MVTASLFSSEYTLAHSALALVPLPLTYESPSEREPMVGAGRRQLETVVVRLRKLFKSIRLGTKSAEWVHLSHYSLRSVDVRMP